MYNTNYTHEFGYDHRSSTNRPRVRSAYYNHSPRHQEQAENFRHSQHSQPHSQSYQTLPQPPQPPHSSRYIGPQELLEHSQFLDFPQTSLHSSPVPSQPHRNYYDLPPAIAFQPAPDQFQGSGRTQSLTSQSFIQSGRRSPQPFLGTIVSLLPRNKSISVTPNLIPPKDSEQNAIYFRRSTESVRDRPKPSFAVKPYERNRSFSYSDSSPKTSDSYSAPSSPSTLASQQRSPVVYPALLSRVAEAFRVRVTLSTKIKDNLEYKGCFDGREAVDNIAYIIKTTDRNLALLLGRALDAQKFFHDVTYDHRLRDSHYELYQFQKMPSFISLNEYEDLSGDEEDESEAEENDLPNGVFTLLTDCYSPTCTRDNVCYSIACPRRLEQHARTNMKPNPILNRSESRGSISDKKDQKLWVHSVSPEIANSVSETEKKRQEAINEVIYTEKDFVRDLEYLRDVWMLPLFHQDLLPENRRYEFVNEVFYNIMEVYTVNSKLADALQKRQNSYAIVEQIGDIFLEFVPSFDPFIKYGAHQLWGKYEFEREKNENPEFAKFVEDTERLPQSRKLELNGYLTKPTTRLGRYPLLLEAVLKQTPQDHPDFTNLPKVISIIREFLTNVNVESGRSENRFNLQHLHDHLKGTEHVDLKLMEEGRQLIFKGTLKKRSGAGESSDLQVFLFDHVLLMVKVKTVNKVEQYKINRKPIPLELLTTSILESPNENIRAVQKRPPSILPAKAPSVVGNMRGNHDKQYALTFSCLGKKGFTITLYATTIISRNKWIEHIKKQQQFLNEKGQVFEKAILLEGKYFSGTNKVNCVAFFDTYRKLALGTDKGVYVTDIGQNPKPPFQVLTMEKVSQIDIIEEFRLLLVLAEKSFYWFPIEALDPEDNNQFNKRPRRISTNASFFKCGVCLGKTLVAVVKITNLSQSTIKTFEPIEQSVKSKSKGPLLKNFFSSGNEALKEYKDFYIPRESTSIHFLSRFLCVGCTKGFEIVDMGSLATQALLNPADASLDFVQKRENVKPIAIFRIPNTGGDLLLCYDEFAFYVNKSGWRSRHNWRIIWEGTPTSFALRDPYLLAFEPSFIEVRNIETGLLEQIIEGHNLRCLYWDTRGNILVVTNDPSSDSSEVFALNLADGRRNSLLSEATSIATTIVAPDESGNNV
ncbi:hypothetical protein G9A89_015142 [Geosiphon pyriformis]|nr:hypothetical protein G9A89_015142 [Geosiphon pyriformis]